MGSSGMYSQLLPYILSKEELCEWGYPVPCADPNRIFIRPSGFESDNANQQKCRCNKSLSLWDDFWYECDSCFYHPLKMSGTSYACCGGSQNSSGCTRSKYHVSSYIMRHIGWQKPVPAASVNRARVNTNIYALDCEFIYTSCGMEVARVSLVSVLHGNLVFDGLVRPVGYVLDYNTRFSGITPGHYLSGPVPALADIHHELSHFINGETILIGHALHTDLIGLCYVHDKIIDTSVLFRHNRGYPYRLPLRGLARDYLGVTIHEKASGHDSVEDAVICTHLLFSNLEKLPNQSERKA